MPQWLRTSLRLAAVVTAAAVISVLGLCVCAGGRRLRLAAQLERRSATISRPGRHLRGAARVRRVRGVGAVQRRPRLRRSRGQRPRRSAPHGERPAVDARKAIQRGLRDYVDAVIADEWAAMAKRRRGDDRAHRRAPRRRVARDPQRASRRTSASTRSTARCCQRFNDLTELRTSRLNAAAHADTDRDEVLLYTGAFIMIGSVYLLAFDKFWLHAIVTAAHRRRDRAHPVPDPRSRHAFSGDWQVEKSAFLRARRAFDRTAHLGHPD